MLGYTGELRLTGCIGYEPIKNDVWNIRFTPNLQERAFSSRIFYLFLAKFSLLLNVKTWSIGVRLREQSNNEKFTDELNLTQENHMLAITL